MCTIEYEYTEKIEKVATERWEIGGHFSINWSVYRCKEYPHIYIQIAAALPFIIYLHAKQETLCFRNNFLALNFSFT